MSSLTGQVPATDRVGDPVIVLPSAPQIRGRGATTLARTRAAVLVGARRSLVRFGTRRTTMADIASASGVAKATLYNHFRAKPDVWRALAQSEVAEIAGALVQTARRDGPVPALAGCALRIGSDDAARKLAETEPAVWAALVLPGATPDPAWDLAREAVADLLGIAGRPCAPAAAEVDVVLRWLVSQLIWPSPADDLERTAAALLAGGSWQTGDQQA